MRRVRIRIKTRARPVCYFKCWPGPWASSRCVCFFKFLARPVCFFNVVVMPQRYGMPHARRLRPPLLTPPPPPPPRPRQTLQDGGSPAGRGRGARPARLQPGHQSRPRCSGTAYGVHKPRTSLRQTLTACLLPLLSVHRAGVLDWAWHHHLHGAHAPHRGRGHVPQLPVPPTNALPRRRTTFVPCARPAATACTDCRGVCPCTPRRQPYGALVTALKEDLQRGSAVGPPWSDWCLQLRALAQGRLRLVGVYGTTPAPHALTLPTRPPYPRALPRL